MKCYRKKYNEIQLIVRGITKMKPYVDSETGVLRTVLLGHVTGFAVGKPINRVQRHYFDRDPPRHDLLVAQYEGFVAMLMSRGVRVARYDPVPDNLGRPFARDALAVIRDHFVICAMKNRGVPYLGRLLEEVDRPPVRVGAGILEGGDIIQDGDAIFVGIGQRSTPEGVAWLGELLGETAEVVPVMLRPDILHLDVVFNRVGPRSALVFPPGIDPASLAELERRYRLIPVTEEEQFALGTNVFSLDPDTVVSGVHQRRINALLRQEGITVLEVEFSEMIKLGGAFRCATCPLERDRP